MYESQIWIIFLGSRRHDLSVEEMHILLPLVFIQRTYSSLFASPSLPLYSPSLSIRISLSSLVSCTAGKIPRRSSPRKYYTYVPRDTTRRRNCFRAIKINKRWKPANGARRANFSPRQSGHAESSYSGIHTMSRPTFPSDNLGKSLRRCQRLGHLWRHSRLARGQRNRASRS